MLVSQLLKIFHQRRRRSTTGSEIVVEVSSEDVVEEQGVALVLDPDDNEARTDPP